MYERALPSMRDALYDWLRGMRRMYLASLQRSAIPTRSSMSVRTANHSWVAGYASATSPQGRESSPPMLAALRRGAEPKATSYSSTYVHAAVAPFMRVLTVHIGFHQAAGVQPDTRGGRDPSVVEAAPFQAHV